jgi:predicted dehydrogenase
MKYAIVGTGSRHKMFRRAVGETYSRANELVALCDVNEHRLALSAAAVPASGNGIATYRAEQFHDMLSEQKPDMVIVTVPDYLHHKYIVEAMRAGCDVMTEKPMTIDLEKLKAILQVQAETGRSITVTFNYRYTPARTQIKDILMSGAIGEITAVNFTWYLDRVHGADYFRRWHRYKNQSGGLLVHKSTHHFDLVNWWLGSSPTAVAAHGRRAFYRPETADAMGLVPRGPRCHVCPSADRCDFKLDIAADGPLRELYLEAEELDGYMRDLCVFDEDITIEDTMQVHALYANGATLNYTLAAYSPWEGLEIKFHGTKGELLHRHVEVHGVFGGKQSKSHGSETMTTILHVAGQEPQGLQVWAGEGDHGGADPVMLSHLFDPSVTGDRYGRGSSHIDGAWSILTGIAANASIETGEMIHIERFLAESGITLPQKQW